MTDRSMIRFSTALLGVFIAVAGPVGAQTIDSSAAAPAKVTPVCWRARPLAKCNSWVVTEAAIETPLYTTSASHTVGGGSFSYVSDDFSTRVAFSLGAMRNVRSDQAVGLTATYSSDDPDVLVPTRLEARFRKWTAEKVGIDASAGLARQTIRGDDELQSIRALGLTAAAGVSNTYFGIDGRVDLLRGNGRPVTAAFLGVRTGSRAAPIATLSGIVLFVAAFTLLAGPDY